MTDGKSINKELILLPLIFLFFMMVTIIITGFQCHQWQMCYNNIKLLGMFEIVSVMMVFM